MMFFFCSGLSLLRGVWIREAELFRQDPGLDPLHLLGLLVGDVVVSEKVETAVYGHMGIVLRKGLTLLLRLALNYLAADDEVSEEVELHLRRALEREREDIRGAVDMATMRMVTSASSLKSSTAASAHFWKSASEGSPSELSDAI